MGPLELTKFKVPKVNAFSYPPLVRMFVAARALATYLIPGCVGRGVRLGSESSSGGGAKMIVRTLRIFFVFKKS